MMKRCYNCRHDLNDNSGGGGGIQCDKCKKNEEKYGKPERCKYCQLPAAFIASKCVYCTHYERKIGSPIPCSKCGLKCAFSKQPTKTVFCRMCSTSLSPEEKLKLKRESQTSILVPDIVEKKPRKSSNSVSFASGSNNLDQVQQLRDQILNLRSTLIQKDQIIMEKDQQIAKLKNNLMMADTDHRLGMKQIHKRNESNVNTLKEQIRDLTKQRFR